MALLTPYSESLIFAGLFVGKKALTMDRPNPEPSNQNTTPENQNRKPEKALIMDCA